MSQERSNKPLTSGRGAVTEGGLMQRSSPQPEHVFNVDLAAWRSTAGKLSLRETGELVRALVRAQSVKRPNREQRILLAIFTRQQAAEDAA